MTIGQPTPNRKAPNFEPILQSAHAHKICWVSIRRKACLFNGFRPIGPADPGIKSVYWQGATDLLLIFPLGPAEMVLVPAAVQGRFRRGQPSGLGVVRP